MYKISEYKYLRYLHGKYPLASSEMFPQHLRPGAVRAPGRAHLGGVRDGVPVSPGKGILSAADPGQDVVGGVIRPVRKRGESV